jgi:hypothetical protein
MGLFSKNKPTTNSITSGESRKTSLASMSSGSLKSPATPGFSKMSIAQVPKVNLPKGPNPEVDPAGYLRSIGAVRERSAIILEKAKANELNHFDVDMSKFDDTTRFVVSIIKVRHTSSNLPNGTYLTLM